MNYHRQSGLAPIAIILIIAGVLVLGGGVWYYTAKYERNKLSYQNPSIAPQPTVQDQTADWKTYMNEQYGFEVKYPGDFNQDFESGYLRFISTRRGVFAITILDKKFDSSNITYKGSDGEGGIKTYKVANALKVKIGDRYAYQYSEGESDAGCGPEIAFQTSLGDKTLHIAFTDCENDALENNDILLILSTFKFIPSTGSGQVPQ